MNCGDDLRIDSHEVYISDFGVRPWWRKTHIDGSSLKVSGTVSYTAPEVILYGDSGLKPEADIWAVGCIGFEILTGRKLFSSAHMIERYYLIRTLPEEQLLILRQVPDIAGILSACLQVDPNDRWSVWILMESLQRLKKVYGV